VTLRQWLAAVATAFALGGLGAIAASADTTTGTTTTTTGTTAPVPTLYSSPQTIQGSITQVDPATHSFVIVGKRVYVEPGTVFHLVRGALAALLLHRRYSVHAVPLNGKLVAVKVTRVMGPVSGRV
jgi:hypothetical protein